ncbi:hypothetical protein NL108_000202, partial [Boleophthalmus pectinirostris]
DEVEEVAAQARQAGIQIFAIGVGRVDMNTLKAIGSEPHSEHVHLVANFSQIETLISVFQSKLCGERDMCEVVDHRCQHICVSSPASYRCKCRTGYILNPDGKTCRAEDICAEVEHGCQHICANIPKGYECRCRPGYQLTIDNKTCNQEIVKGPILSYFVIYVINFPHQKHTWCCVLFQTENTLFHLVMSFAYLLYCVFKLHTPSLESAVLLDLVHLFATEIDYCDLGLHNCEQDCISIPESYICRCGKGYVLNPDKHTCRKIDHCADGTHGCEQKFENTETSCVCKCKKGYKLRADGKTCLSLDLCQTVDHGCEHLCVNTNDSYVCKCFEGFTLAEDQKSCKKPDCNSGVIDVVFVIDGSKSLGPANFELVKQFVSTIVDAFDVSRTGTHVGLIQYSTKVRTEFTLDQFSSARDVKQAVSRMQYMGRGSLTGSALRHMFETSFSPREGARANVQRVSIVFTDGRSQDDVSEWATKAKES